MAFQIDDADFLTMTVAALKQKIQDQEGLSPTQQRLVWAGKTLEDEYLLTDYNVQNKSALVLVVRLHGGHRGADKPLSIKDLTGASAIQAIVSFHEDLFSKMTVAGLERLVEEQTGCRQRSSA